MKPKFIILLALCLSNIVIVEAQTSGYNIDWSNPAGKISQINLDYVDWDGKEWNAFPTPDYTFNLQLTQSVISDAIYYKRWDGINRWASFSNDWFDDYNDANGDYHHTSEMNTFNWGGQQQKVALRGDWFFHPGGQLTDWIDYIAWDGSKWTVAILQDRIFILAPGVNGQLKKNVDEIDYIGWDGQHWTAALTSSGFHMINQKTSQVVDSRYIYYLTRGWIKSAARMEGGGSVVIEFTVAPDPYHTLPPLQSITLPHHPLLPSHLISTRQRSGRGHQSRPCSFPTGVTFVAQRDCCVETYKGKHCLDQGQSYTVEVPIGQTMIDYSTGIVTTQGGTYVAFSRGYAGRCDILQVP